MRKKKIIAGILALLLSGCTQGQANIGKLEEDIDREETTAEDSETAEETEAETVIEEETEPEPPALEDFEGSTLKIFDIGSVDDRYHSMFDAPNMQSVLDEVEILYNCKIEELNLTDYKKELLKSILVGESICDFGIFPADYIYENLCDNVLKPWNDRYSVNLSQPWWDKGGNAAYNLNHKQIALTGAFNINNYAHAMCYAYNRTILDGNIYTDNWGTSEAFSDRLMWDVGRYWDGSFTISGTNSHYIYKGGICGSLFDYYRTMQAASSICFLNWMDNRLSLNIEDPRDTSFENYWNHSLQFLDGVQSEDILNTETWIQVANESYDLSGMGDYLACDETLFLDGVSTFKIIHMEDFAALRNSGMNVGIVALTGDALFREGCYTLIDLPTFAMQQITAMNEHFSLVILDAIASRALETVVPAYKEIVIGEKTNEDGIDNDTQWDRDSRMFDVIFSKPFYEFDIGEAGEQLQYLYYKYMIRHEGKVSKDKFNLACAKLISEVDKGNASYEDFLAKDITITGTVANVFSVTYSDGTAIFEGTGEIPTGIDSWLNPFGDIQIDEIIFEEGITSLAEGAFSTLNEYKKIQLPSTIKKIKSNTFSKMHVEELMLPDSITSIQENALKNMRIGILTIPGTVEELPYDAIVDTYIKELHIAEGMKVLNNYAFNLTKSYFGIEAVYLPKSIERIYEDAFKKFSIDAVYYAGTEEEWDEVAIYADNILDATIYFNS